MHIEKKGYTISVSLKRFKFNSVSETRLGNGNGGEADHQKKTSHLETLKVKSREGGEWEVRLNQDNLFERRKVKTGYGAL